MTKLPIKARVLEYLAEKDCPVSGREMAEALKDEYPGEKTASEAKLEQTMLCYCRVGFVEPAEILMDGDEELLQFRITDLGKEEIVYVPGHGNKLV